MNPIFFGYKKNRNVSFTGWIGENCDRGTLTSTAGYIVFDIVAVDPKSFILDSYFHCGGGHCRWFGLEQV